MSETFTIDKALLGNIKKRMSVRLAILMFIPIGIVFVPQFLDKNGPGIQINLIVLCIALTLMIFTTGRVLNRQVDSFKTLKIVLDDEGIERKANLQPYKRILWNNLKAKEKANGGILLSDKTISGFNRKMYGKGVIYVYPETLDKDKLMNTIRIKAPYAF